MLHAPRPRLLAVSGGGALGMRLMIGPSSFFPRLMIGPVPTHARGWSWSTAGAIEGVVGHSSSDGWMLRQNGKWAVGAITGWDRRPLAGGGGPAGTRSKSIIGWSELGLNGQVDSDPPHHKAPVRMRKDTCS